MTVGRNQVREAMQAAASRLKLRIGEDGVSTDFLIESFASTISNMVEGEGHQDTREPRKAGQIHVEDELALFVRHAAKLREAIADISPNTMQSLWDAPSMRSRDGGIYRIDVRQLLERLSVDLTHLQAIAKHAPVSAGATREVRGNRADLWVRGVIKVTAWHFRKMTGREIDRSREPGSFHALLSEVFAALGIKRSVEVAVRDAKRKAWT